MRIPISFALSIALLVSLALVPAANARGEAGADPTRATAARGDGQTLKERRVLRRQRQAAKRRSRQSRSERPTPVASPAPEPAPIAAPQPEASPSPAVEPAPNPAPRPAPGAEPAPEPSSEPAPAPAPLLDAGFENGLSGWSTAGVGDATPGVTGDIVRSGSKSAKFLLTGSQGRSELILGGDGSGSTSGAARFYEGDEYWYGFSFYIESMVYGRPGAHNLIMQFKSADSGSPAFGLMLWDHQGRRGLWSHGTGMGGDRFLAATAEQEWHDVVIHFEASSTGDGFYELYLDGNLIDSRSAASMIVPGSSNAYIKDGLYRNGGAIPGTSEIYFDAARLGTSSASVAVS